MPFLSVVLAFFSVASSFLQADIFRLPDPISLTKGIGALNYDFFEKTMKYPKLRKRGIIQCAEIKELEGALVCASSKLDYMNKAIGRAALFSEGAAGVEKGLVHKPDSQPFLNMLTNSIGHDIPSEAVMGFWNTLQKACETGETCPSPEETELFEKVILPLSFKRPHFVVITYSLDASWFHAISHELLHAQYFLDSRFRETVDRFWCETVTPEDREKIVELLGVDYNRNDVFLMRNEFQAFLLDIRASEGVLKDFVPTYQEQLIQKLKEAGVELLKAS